MSMTNQLLEALRHVVGATNVFTDGDLSAWERDWRQRSHGKAMAVVLPASTDEVAQVVQLCAAHRAKHPESGLSLVPQGGNTGLTGGSVPDASGRQIVLGLTRMNAVRDIDAANLTMTAEAGCILQNLQEAAANVDLLFPLSLAAEGSCTLGGNLGTNAGGTQVLRYGNARELCLGLEVVTAQGEVWNGLTGLRKDNTGYDLRDLLVGSEGTLGIITAATVKLFPLPAAQLTAWAAVPSLEAAVQLLGLAHQHLGPGLTGFEVMEQFALSLVTRHFPAMRMPFIAEPHAAAPTPAPWHVLLENSDHVSETHARERFERLMELAIESGCVVDAVVAESLTQARQLWHVRESIPLAQVKEGPNIKHDISLPISRIVDFVHATDAALQQAIPGVRMVNFGHLGDGNLHYNVQAPEGVPDQDFLERHEDAVNRLVYASVVQHGGSISAEHGIGSFKLDYLQTYKSPVALGLMRAIKQALDPQGLLNPGRVVAT
jgi:FAD/FMN-containing dehydrogenase